MRLEHLLKTSLIFLFHTATLSLSTSTPSLATIQQDNFQHPPPLSLHPRVFPFDAYLRFYDPALALIIPIAIGSILSGLAVLTILARLFSNILDTCISIWAHSPPSNQVVIEAGSLRLEFGCSVEPVPWEFIAEFAKSQGDAVERGFAPVFAREWWFDVQGKGRICYAGVRVVEEGGQVVPPGRV